MQVNYVLTEGARTDFIIVSSPQPVEYQWDRFGGDAQNGSDYLLTWRQGLDFIFVDDSGTMDNPPLGASFSMQTQQDHKAESAETVNFHIVTTTGLRVTAYDITVTILDRSTRDEYVGSAMAKAAVTFDPATQPNQLLEQAYVNQISDFMGPVNDPTNSNQEAHQAQQYLLGTLIAVDGGRMGAVPLVSSDFTALRWAADHFDRTWLTSDPPSFDGSPPMGVLDVIEGFIEGTNGAWRQHLPGGTAAGTTTPFTVDVRASDQGVFQDLGLFRHDAYSMTTGPDLLPAGPVQLLVDKIGGTYSLSPNDDGLLASGPVNVSLGKGDDFAVATAVGSQLFGDDGDDVLVLGDGGGTLHGGSGVDLLVAGNGATVLRGDDGDDYIVGGPSFDNVNGNRGDDTIDGGTGGNDWLSGGQGSDLITAHAGQTVIYGNLGDDTLVGGSGAETIRGGQGDDVIRGGAGDDWISGDLGNDTLSGGAGSDVFHVPAGAGAGNDVILDFDATHDHVLLDPGVRFVAQQSGADTVVTLTVGLESNQLTLVGVKLNNMPSDWIGVG